MAKKTNISRRQFVASAVSVAAASTVQGRRAFAEIIADGTTTLSPSRAGRGCADQLPALEGSGNRKPHQITSCQAKRHPRARRYDY